MEARIRNGVRVRVDSFGGVCYVPHRDDFFAVDKSVIAVLRLLSPDWSIVSETCVDPVRSLAQLGLCETREPESSEIAYSGPSFIGAFRDIATVSEPLVVNCFTTAFCPLRCRYCHADDLMQQYRESERDQDVENVAATAALVPAMVAVITGGDPLTRPDRAIALMERLSHHKALVLDTSGVGDMWQLVPHLKKHGVHVRVSIDAISEVNNKLRPTNTAIVGKGVDSLGSATAALEICVHENIPVTVQTVLTSLNSGYDELRDLRDWLVSKSVRNWVLHICIEAGSARRLVEESQKHTRGRSILPQEPVYKTVKQLMNDTAAKKLHLDIRCTDTGNTPNSVILISSNGDLFTEGLAHNGKVKLFDAREARPDLIKAMWSHIDHFGHARRYLNWNTWFYEGQNLEDLTFRVPKTPQFSETRARLVETEAKYVVRDVDKLVELLRSCSAKSLGTVLQRDEYFDTPTSALAGSDFVLRLRYVDAKCDLCLKGPRFRSQNNEYSRIELEVPPLSKEAANEAIASQGLVCTWYFEKRRTTFTLPGSSAKVFLDEIPEVGHFIEIEGTLDGIRALASQLADGLGSHETRNYKELFVAFKNQDGNLAVEVRGAAFAK